MSQTEVQLIKTNAVQTGDIANSAVTDEKIAGLTSSKLTGALPAISGASLTNLPASGKAKNLIVNGSCRVAQRGQSSTSNLYATVDRFRFAYSGVDENPTNAQVDVASGTTPYTLGFRKAVKVTNGNQTSGAGSADRIAFEYRIEAQDIAGSGWNYASASSNITLSFWIKSSVAQTFYFYFETVDGTAQIYSMSTGALSADTWTKVTKTIPGNSNLQFDNNNDIGLKLQFMYYTGTDYTDNSQSLNTWGTYSSASRSPDQTTTWYTTNDSTLEITGLQLEVGDSATDFEHLSFQEDYLRCARYYIQMNRLPVMSNRLAGYCSCTTRFNPVPMRAIPSLSIDGTLSFNSFFYGQATPTTTNTPGFQNNGDSGQPYGGDNMILNFSGFSTSGFQTNEFGEVYGTTIRINAEL